jgi:hypothetical protein
MKKPKKLINIIDLLGREIPLRKNAVLLFVYQDGTVEQLFEIE